jgi:hypothetical protein
MAGGALAVTNVPNNGASPINPASIGAITDTGAAQDEDAVTLEIGGVSGDGTVVDVYESNDGANFVFLARLFGGGPSQTIQDIARYFETVRQKGTTPVVVQWGKASGAGSSGAPAWLLGGNPSGPSSLGLLDGTDVTIGGLSAGSATHIASGAGANITVTGANGLAITATTNSASLTSSAGIASVVGQTGASLQTVGGTATVQGPAASLIATSAIATINGFTGVHITEGGTTWVWPTSDGVPGAVWTTDGAGNGSFVAPTKATFEADVSLVTQTTPQFIPSGSGSTTSTTATRRTLQASGGSVSSLIVNFTGDVLNVGGQTATISINKNGAPVAGAATAALPTTAGVHSAVVSFAAVPQMTGDFYDAQLVVGGAPLTAALTNVMVALR